MYKDDGVLLNIDFHYSFLFTDTTYNKISILQISNMNLFAIKKHKFNKLVYKIA